MINIILLFLLFVLLINYIIVNSRYRSLKDREFWIRSMKIIINPIILTLCKTATQYMKMLKNNKQSSSHFEAFSRTFNGISLWFNLINILNKHEYYYHLQIKK